MRFSLLIIIAIFFSNRAQSQQELNIDDYLEADKLLEVSETKDKLQKKQAQKLFDEKKRRYSYPSFEDFWKFASEYWLVKNIDKIKWDQGSDASEVKKNFQLLLNDLGIEGIKLKVFIFPTDRHPHFVLPRSDREFVFLISQKFIEASRLNPKQLSYLLLEELIRIQQGYLFDFFKDDSFVKNLGESFYINKRPAMGDFEKLMTKISIFYLEHGFSFENEYRVTKSICKKLSDKPVRLKAYRNYFESLKSQIDAIHKVFVDYKKLYPGFEMKHLWCR